MNINVIVLTLLAAVIGMYTWKAFFNLDKPVQIGSLPLPIQVGKSRSFVNQTRDAGMFTERTRRAAIISNRDPVFISSNGSTNGSLEWYFLSSILVAPPKPLCPSEPEKVVWSNGDADDEICDIVDAGGAFGAYELLDLGGAGGNDCDV